MHRRVPTVARDSLGAGVPLPPPLAAAAAAPRRRPGDSFDLNMPLDPKFTEQYAREILLKRMGKVLPTSLVDAKEPAGQVVSAGAVSEEGQATKKEDYVAFFERTVPMLDVSIAASHGRLLLCRSRSRYYVCDPAANRWLVLPPSSFPPTHDTASGLHYDINASTTGCLSFTVVLLVRIAHRRVLVDTFSSTTGRWDTKVINTQGVARCLGAASPGIHVGTSFYWLSRRRGRATVLREPPMAEGSQERVGRTLGSTAGGRRLRVCAFDIRDDKSGSMMPHDDIEGVHGVWVMDDGSVGSWRRVHEAVVGGISAYYFGRLCGHEVPVDFAGACSEFIIVESEYLLRRYELGSGRQVTLASLRTMASDLRELYGSYRAFPFFRPA
ncbi:hypothetical protein EJB05_32526, partial [Eragrostis curvula]